MEEQKDIEYGMRDLRVYHAWQSQNALRTLYENHEGVESRNLVSLYVALTLKATYCGFQDTYHTTSKAICEYTHLSHDFVPVGLRMLEADGLIKVEERRDAKGFVLGKTIALTDAPRFVNRDQKTGTSFLERSEYNVKTGVESVDSSLKSVEREASEDAIVATPESPVKGFLIEADTWALFSDVLLYGTEIGVFSKPTIVEEGELTRVPKYLYYALQKLINLQQGRFASVYKMDKFPVTANNWRESVFRALDNLKIMKEDGRVWPTNKNTLPKNLDAFLYNVRSGYSWLVKCLETQVTEKEEIIEEKYGDVVEDKHIHAFDKWFDYYFYELDYEQQVNLKRNIGELIAEHKKMWETYGQHYTKMGKWHQYLGGADPTKFIQVYASFLLEKNFSAHEASIRPGSKVFTIFRRWLRTEYGLNTDMSATEMKALADKAKGNEIVSTVSKVPRTLPGIADGVITPDRMVRSGQEDEASGVLQD